MALVPKNYWRDWWEDFDRPQRFLDEHFEMAIQRTDLLKNLSLPKYRTYFRPWRNLLDGTSSEIKLENDSERFKVILDVGAFSPHEILVKTIDNSIIVEAKHEEKPDSHGFVSRKFLRRYDLPRGLDISRVMSNLSTDGILTITAPKHRPPPGTRVVPVERTYFPALKR